MDQQDSQSAGQLSDARIAGGLLILTALATGGAVVARVAVDADQHTLAESLSAISRSRGLYGLGGVALLVSGVALMGAAWYLSKAWIIRERLGAPLVPILLAVSGGFTAVSGACAVMLTASAQAASVGDAISPMIENAATLRWLTGKIGFAVAGVALIVASLYQWRVGGALRYVAPYSLIVGAAMQFIWIDAATVAHRIIGPAFFVWLVVVGGMLVVGWVAREWILAYERKSS